MPIKDKEKRRLYWIEYRKIHADEIKARKILYYNKNREEIQRKNKEYFKTEKGKLVEIESKKRYRESLKGKAATHRVYIKFKSKHPLKYKARQITRNAINRNKIKRDPCVVCGEFPTQAHHQDYRFPLKIIWLCHLHHYQEHGKLLNK